MKVMKKIKIAALSTVIAATAAVVPNAVMAQTVQQNSFTPSSLIQPFMGNERVVVSGDLTVDNSHTFGAFSLKNTSLKVVFNASSTSKFTLDVMYHAAGVGGEVVDRSKSFSVGAGKSQTQYIEKLAKGQDNTLRVRGSAYGTIGAYDFGPIQ